MTFFKLIIIYFAIRCTLFIYNNNIIINDVDGDIAIVIDHADFYTCYIIIHVLMTFIILEHNKNCAMHAIASHMP